ncbi:MAG: hypothetical protein GX811_04210 [Lentisphaerae bacterium]|nr:hypothetical protein [Lentisphaerota bacterium]
MSNNLTVFNCGPVEITVTPDEATMGRLTAEYIIDKIIEKNNAGTPVALWLMAAPSAFGFYNELIATAEKDENLRNILRDTHFFQFDDYPISRQSPKFEATFRRLLEKHLFEPLAKVCGTLNNVHPLDLTGEESDAKVCEDYRDTILNLKKEGVYFLQLKGIGMDGHWGFHGAETPLDIEPGIITVPMNSQNIRQQMIDWPEFFPTVEDVPAHACTFNVPMFLLADEVIDNVPQSSKEYSVLAVYGTDDVFNAAPSSAIKQHKKARAYLTEAASVTLLDFLATRKEDPKAFLKPETHERLRALWNDPTDPETTARNIELMDEVLRDLGMIA